MIENSSYCNFVIMNSIQTKVSRKFFGLEKFKTIDNFYILQVAQGFKLRKLATYFFFIFFSQILRGKMFFRF